MAGGFVKVYEEITRSSVWLEDHATRIVWITMLVAAGPDGIVRASRGGLAHLANVSRDECDAALATLEAPDDDSRSKEFDGRRIEEVDGGWIVLNHAKYRERQSERNAKAAERMRRYRERKRNKRNVTRNGSNAPQRDAEFAPEAEAEAEAEAEGRDQRADPAPSGTGPLSNTGDRDEPIGDADELPTPGRVVQGAQNQRSGPPDGRDGAGDARTGRGGRGGDARAQLSHRGDRGTRPAREPSPEAIAAAQYLYDAIRSHSPDFMAEAKPSAVAKKLTGWARDIDRGIRNDGMSLDGCRTAIDAAHRSSDQFWRPNLLSGNALRKHYEKLRIRAGPRSQAGFTADGERLDEIDYDIYRTGPR